MHNVPLPPPHVAVGQVAGEFRAFGDDVRVPDGSDTQRLGIREHLAFLVGLGRRSDLGRTILGPAHEVRDEIDVLGHLKLGHISAIRPVVAAILGDVLSPIHAEIERTKGKFSGHGR